MTLVWSDVAAADLDDICDFIARDVPYSQSCLSIVSLLRHASSKITRESDGVYPRPVTGTISRRSLCRAIGLSIGSTLIAFSS